MESADTHNLQEHHQLQDQLDESSSSSYGLAWNPNTSLNYNELFNSSSRQIKNDNSLIHDLGLNWPNHVSPSFTITQPAAAQIKHEISSSSPQDQKFTDMLNPPISIEDLSEKLLLKTISSGFPLNPFSSSDFFSNNCTSNFGSATIPSRGNYSQIYPSVHISSFNSPSSSYDSPTSNFGHDQMQHSSNGQLCNPSMLYNNEASSDQTKRSNCLNNIEAKELTQSAHKKTRTETRSSCPPFKVRKEKLGDRIATLQQLVAPFGKTDTASVLMEAIGYIKFLQHQVETLSVPYMKSSRNKNNKTMQRGSISEEWEEEPKRDLKSRGLCLVPLSCMSYVTNDSGGAAAAGGGIWPPSKFGGGT